MRHFHNILYVDEPTTTQTSSIARAVALAENNQANLSLLHVAAKPRLGLLNHRYNDESLAKSIQEHELDKLSAWLEPYRERKNIPIKIRFGTPFVEILREVQALDYDLVIKPIADTGIDDYLFGSDDMQLLRKCPCPVWLLQPNDSNNYKRILAAVDFNPWNDETGNTEANLNQQILTLASSLAVSDFAELHLVHVWESLSENVLRMYGSNNSEDSTLAYLEQELQHHRDEFNQLLTKLQGWIGEEAFNYLKPQAHLLRGNALKVIPKLTTELEVDLLVMGTLSRTGIRGLFIGNTAEGILNRVGCSVLTVKPESFNLPEDFIE
jgi:universal stress protein E